MITWSPTGVATPIKAREVAVLIIVIQYQWSKVSSTGETVVASQLQAVYTDMFEVDFFQTRESRLCLQTIKEGSTSLKICLLRLMRFYKKNKTYFEKVFYVISCIVVLLQHLVKCYSTWIHLILSGSWVKYKNLFFHGLKILDALGKLLSCIEWSPYDFCLFIFFTVNQLYLFVLSFLLQYSPMWKPSYSLLLTCHDWPQDKLLNVNVWQRGRRAWSSIYLSQTPEPQPFGSAFA